MNSYDRELTKVELNQIKIRVLITYSVNNFFKTLKFYKIFRIAKSLQFKSKIIFIFKQ